MKRDLTSDDRTLSWASAALAAPTVAEQNPLAARAMPRLFEAARALGGWAWFERNVHPRLGRALFFSLVTPGRNDALAGRLAQVLAPLNPDPAPGSMDHLITLVRTRSDGAARSAQAWCALSQWHAELALAWARETAKIEKPLVTSARLVDWMLDQLGFSSPQRAQLAHKRLGWIGNPRQRSRDLRHEPHVHELAMSFEGAPPFRYPARWTAASERTAFGAAPSLLRVARAGRPLLRAALPLAAEVSTTSAVRWTNLLVQQAASRLGFYTTHTMAVLLLAVAHRAEASLRTRPSDGGDPLRALCARRAFASGFYRAGGFP